MKVQYGIAHLQSLEVLTLIVREFPGLITGTEVNGADLTQVLSFHLSASKTLARYLKKIAIEYGDDT